MVKVGRKKKAFQPEEGKREDKIRSPFFSLEMDEGLGKATSTGTSFEEGLIETGPEIGNRGRSGWRGLA